MRAWWSDIPVVGRLANRPLVNVVRLHGPIGMGMGIGRNLSLSGVAGALEQAFSGNRVKAVALCINSPGGMPVQSMLIHNRVRALAEEKNVPVVTFAEDVAASGGYILALAGDEIFADASSIIGSIGVVSAGFGFQGLIEKIGVERRLHTAGENKAILDAFQPEKPEDVARLKTIQKEIHTSFIDLVSERRKGQIDTSDKEIFSGAFWTGGQALKMGLIDGLGDVRQVMRERFGEKVQLRLISGVVPWWRRRQQHVLTLSRFASPDLQLPLINGAWADDLLSALEARALWSRFGL